MNYFPIDFLESLSACLIGSGTRYMQDAVTILTADSKEILCPIDMIIGLILSSVAFKAHPQILPDFPIKSILSPAEIRFLDNFFTLATVMPSTANTVFPHPIVGISTITPK